MASLVFRLTGDPSSFKSATSDCGRSLDTLASKADRVSQRMASMGNSLSIGITAPILAMGAGVVNAAAKMDTLQRALLSTTGNAKEAAEQFDRLQTIAKLPGIGLEEAVRGSIRLQNYGLSAALSERALKAFSNAVAGAGGTADDTSEALRQLGQMYGRGKITMDNLRIILERVPQAAAVIRKEWGSDALADPAKAFEKLGLNSAQVIETLIDKLGDLQKVQPGIRTGLENLQQEVTKSAARIGEKLTPAIIELLPKLEKMATGVADAVDAFTKLPDSVQSITVGFAALAIAAGPVLRVLSGIGPAVVGMNTYLLASGTAIAAAGGAAASSTSTFAAMSLGIAALTLKLTAVASAAYLAYAGFQLFTSLQKESESVNNLSFSTEKLLERVRKVHPEIGALELRYRNGTVSLQEFNAEVLRLAKGMYAKSEVITSTIPKVKQLGEEHGKASNIIKVSSVAGLIYVESLERTKAAVSKVKDVMYEWSVQGTLQGKMLEMQAAPLSNLAILADDYRLALSKARFELEALGNMPPIKMATPTQPTRRGTVLETVDILGSDSSKSRADRVTQAERDLERIKQLNQEGKATGNDVIEAQIRLKKAQDDTGAAAKESGKAQTAAMRQVSLVVNDLARGITDIIFKGGKMGDMFKNVAMQAAQSITRLLIEGALTRLSSKILDVGGLFGKVFGGGTGAVMSAVPGVTAVGLGGQIGAGAAIPSATSGIASAASAGISGIVGAVAGVGSLISGIVGNFQMAGMNKSLDLIEHEVRYSQIHLLNTLNQANKYWPYMQAAWESLVRMEQRQMAPAGGGVTINMQGNTFGAGFDQDAFARNLLRTLKNNGY